MPEAPRLKVRRSVAIFAVALALKMLSPPIEGNAAVLLRAYARDEQFVAMFPIFIRARLDHLLGCITPRVRILFQAAPR